jgi:hypothetical protein
VGCTITASGSAYSTSGCSISARTAFHTSSVEGPEGVSKAVPPRIAIATPCGFWGPEGRARFDFEPPLPGSFTVCQRATSPPGSTCGRSAESRVRCVATVGIASTTEPSARTPADRAMAVNVRRREVRAIARRATGVLSRSFT